MSSTELGALKMDIEEYIKEAKSLDIKFDPKVAKRLEQVSARVHVSQLDGIRTRMLMHVERLFGEQERFLVEDGTRTALDVNARYNDELAGLKPSFDEARALKVISEPWAYDGSNFSDRIWKNKQNLMRILDRELVQGVIRGDNYNKLMARLTRELGASEHAAGRLIMTESAAFATMAQKETYSALGSQKVEILETIDVHTCEECASMSGRIIDIKDMETGVTVPPFHPWCRGTTMPVVPDNDNPDGNDLDEDQQRAVMDWSEPECPYGCPAIRAYQNNPDGSHHEKTVSNEQLLEKAIAEHGNYKGELYRGIVVPEEVANSYQFGETVQQYGTSSWSKDKNISFKYLEENDNGGVKVCFHVKKSYEGLDITKLSIHPEDLEVTHSKNKKWTVQNTIYENDILIVDLVEP